MLYLVQIEVVLVIVMGAFVGIEVVFKFCLQPCIGGLGPQHIPILGRVGGGP